MKRLGTGVATSLADARPGQMMYFDDQGGLMSPAVLRRRRVGYGIGCGITLGLGSLFSYAYAGPVAAVVAPAVVVGMVVWAGRDALALRRAWRLLAAGRHAEAHTALVALADKLKPPGDLRAFTQAARLDVALGRPEAALERLEPQRARLARCTRGYPLQHRWHAGMTRVMALVELRRLDEARAVRDELAGLPRGEVNDFRLQWIELSLAVAGGSADVLPATEVLHDWARAALLRTLYAEMLVALSWAFAERKDEDMARHLLAEAHRRCDDRTLRAGKILGPWYAERLERWKIAESGELT